MKKINIYFILFCLLSTLLFAEEKRKIIIDTDTGGDDAMALMMATKCSDIEILGVCVVAGNVPLEQGAKNALQVLEKTECDVPVFYGANESFKGIKTECFSVYGKDGMGDKDLIHPKGSIEEKSAIDFMIETVATNPNQIEIVIIGPITDLALAFQKDPQTMKKVKKIWFMGTAGFGHGNATPVAEFNVYKDPEAFDYVLKNKVPMTIVGLDMCNTTISGHEVEKIIKNGSDLQKFAMLVNTGLLKFSREQNNTDGIVVCDQTLMACVIWTDFVTDSIMTRASCITDSSEARGLVIFYKQGFVYDTMPDTSEANVEVISGVNSKVLIRRMMKLLK